MERSINKQMVTSEYICRFWDNLIKVKKDKSTRVLLTMRLELLETYWTTFYEEHNNLVRLDKLGAIEYMNSDVFGTTKERYLDTKTRIRYYLQGDTSTTRASQHGDAGSVLANCRKSIYRISTVIS